MMTPLRTGVALAITVGLFYSLRSWPFSSLGCVRCHRCLYHAQRRNELAKSGPYAHIRHPQYVAFVLILLGFLLQWPTLLTLVMFPILVAMYARVAITEEVEMRKRFGAEFEVYAARTPRFVPSFRKEASVA